MPKRSPCTTFVGHTLSQMADQRFFCAFNKAKPVWPTAAKLTAIEVVSPTVGRAGAKKNRGR